eukprot:gene4273-biopygen15957
MSSTCGAHPLSPCSPAPALVRLQTGHCLERRSPTPEAVLEGAEAAQAFNVVDQPSVEDFAKQMTQGRGHRDPPALGESAVVGGEVRPRLVAGVVAVGHEVLQGHAAYSNELPVRAVLRETCKNWTQCICGNEWFDEINGDTLVAPP